MICDTYLYPLDDEEDCELLKIELDVELEDEADDRELSDVPVDVLDLLDSLDKLDGLDIEVDTDEEIELAEEDDADEVEDSSKILLDVPVTTCDVVKTALDGYQDRVSPNKGLDGVIVGKYPMMNPSSIVP